MTKPLPPLDDSHPRIVCTSANVNLREVETLLESLCGTLDAFADVKQETRAIDAVDTSAATQRLALVVLFMSTFANRDAFTLDDAARYLYDWSERVSRDLVARCQQ